MVTQIQADPAKITDVFQRASDNLTEVGLPTQHYVIPDFDGYEPVIGSAKTDVYCLEARLGPTHNRPGYSSYAVAQVFHPRYPSMALVLMISRHDIDGTLDGIQPAYNPSLDKSFSYIFLPNMYTAFNSLDLSGQNKGLLVQSYAARITLSDIPQAAIASTKLILRYKSDGQLACLAVDFNDSFTRLVAQLVTPLKSIRDMHFIPRSDIFSKIRIPLKSNENQFYLIEDNSTALDLGFDLAINYLEKHYLKVNYVA